MLRVRERERRLAELLERISMFRDSPDNCCVSADDDPVRTRCPAVVHGGGSAASAVAAADIGNVDGDRCCGY